MLTPWSKLWEIATDNVDGRGIARIEPDPEDEGSVVLVWPDGSRAELYWHGGGWLFSETLSGARAE